MVLGAATRLMARTDAATRGAVRIPEFHAGTTTHVVGGTGVADRVGTYAATYGSRALLVTGSAHARETGLLARIEASLAHAGVVSGLLEGIGSDPTTSVIDAGATLARSIRADLVVAVGGGSVVDAAKAIATAAADPDRRPFRDHLSGLRPAGFLVVDALPVVAVPTLPGSGSETNGTSVVIDDETGRKLSAHSDLVAPRIALLDPELLLQASRELLAPGFVDAVCHALEAGLSSRATIASDALAEQGLRTLLRTAGEACATDRPDRSRVLLEGWWATNLAGQALTMAGSIVTHPLAHPLSARHGIRHGSAVAALEPAVVATFAERFAAAGSLQKVARWLDVRAADDPDAATRGILTRFARCCASVELRSSMTQLGVGADDLPEIVRDARASGSRGLANTGGSEPSPEELFAVLDVAADCGPASSARRTMAAADRAAP